MPKLLGISFAVVVVATLLIVSNLNVEGRHYEDKHSKWERQYDGFDSWSEEEGGLSMDYYDKSCPMVYDIVRQQVKNIVDQDPGQAAGILRIMFHDCFVQGCDASILLDKPSTEQTATPNNASLRTSSIRALDDIKEALEAACPCVVSCADTIALATSFAVHMVGGPMIYMPTGRRDSIEAANNQTVTNSLPAPTLDISQLKALFQSQGLDVKDLVALSGGHSIGKAHCKAVTPQLEPTISQDLNRIYAKKLSKVCLPTSDTDRELDMVDLDILTQTQFDNAYFHNVLAKRATFHSDATLLDDADSAQLVQDYADNQLKFFDQFALSMIKMGQLQVLTGRRGVIRKRCSIPK